VPGKPHSAEIIDVPDPPLSDGAVLVRGRLVGMCGTDAEIVNDGYGTIPAGADRLVLGHESLGEVIDAPPETGLRPGDLVSGIVRRPDPEPCAACAAGQWDLCRNGRFVERGISGAPGYGSELWRVDGDYAIKIDPALGGLGVLLESTSVVAKAWAQVDRISAGLPYAPEVAVITGAGPVGLLAAMLARQRGLDTWVLDIVTGGPKPQLVAGLGATYSAARASELPVRPDIVIECTGIGPVLADVFASVSPNATIALAGLSHHPHLTTADVSSVNRQLVLGNQVIFGTVNAGRRHYHQAADALSRADPGWLASLITRQVPMDDWADALVKQPDDIKVTVALDDANSGAGP
jgi:threonine dehydrogenase-like Zn-dependent dehydrogenase